MLKYGVLEGPDPGKLTTVINKNVAPPDIEQSLLNSYTRGSQQARQFMMDRFVRSSENKTKQLFNSSMKKNKSPTFTNLYDVKFSANSQQKKVTNESQKVLQRICVAYKAGREVDLKLAASHEIMSVPISLFNEDKTMRSGNNSDLMKLIRSSAKVETFNSIPSTDPENTQYVIDCMAHIRRVSTKGATTFGEFVDRFCETVYKVPASRIDIVMDRYEQASIKDATRQIRSQRATKGHKKNT